MLIHLRQQYLISYKVSLLYFALKCISHKNELKVTWLCDFFWGGGGSNWRNPCWNISPAWLIHYIHSKEDAEWFLCVGITRNLIKNGLHGELFWLRLYYVWKAVSVLNSHGNQKCFVFTEINKKKERSIKPCRSLINVSKDNLILWDVTPSECMDSYWVSLLWIFLNFFLLKFLFSNYPRIHVINHQFMSI